MDAILKLEDLAIGYSQTSPIMVGNAGIGSGVTALIGRNGAGKSTLIKTITGNRQPLKGRVLLFGKPIGKYSKKDLSRLIALVTTETHMAGGLTLREMVELGRIPFTGRFGFLSSSDRRVVDEALDAVGISRLADKFVGRLSDGERQKGMIARGLVQETPLIIMDEPFSFLDVASRLELLALIGSLASEKSRTFLFSTHEVSEALRMAGNIWMFTSDGFVSGKPSQIIGSGAIRSLFPGSPVKFNPETYDFII